MLSKIAGSKDYMRMLEDKYLSTVQNEFSSKIKRVQGADTFMKSGSLEEHLEQFLTKEEFEDVKKILNKPTDEGFDELFKQECEKLKRKNKK